MSKQFLSGWHGLASVLVLGSGVILPLAVSARPVPDDTLGTERSRVVDRSARDFDVDGGARRGSNLFHSFQEFNIDDGGSVYFLNPEGVENILSRVTGNDPSDILGTLGVHGAANLFFMNPNGILFGPNARLDVQGSFVGTTANAIGFGEQGFFSAGDGAIPGLLTVNPSAFLFNQIANSGGTIINTGNLTAGQDLTLSGNNLDLQGQLAAGGNLTLEAQDTLRIRDSATTPFVAAAVGQLLLQGNRVVDIFALNHPQSGLVSGGDMVLRSANQVGGDAHYWSGGNFRIEQLDGSLGDLYSPHDPIIRVTGDLTLNNYVGNSLHILAGGSVVIPGTIAIIDSDTPATTLSEAITLSDGTGIVIDGSVQPTLDIRAGVDPSVVAVSDGFEQIGTGNFPGGGTFSRIPTSAGIVVGSVIMVPPEGQVLITNQYRPNPSLPTPDIIITGRGISRPGAENPVLGIDARGFGGNGSSVTLDARGQILLFRERSIDSSADLGQSGNIRLIAGEGISLGNLASISAFSADRGGNISLSTNGDVELGTGASILTASGGNIEVQANQLTMEPLSQISAPVNNARNGGNIVLRVSNSIQVDGGNIGTLVLAPPTTNPLQDFGDTGDIIIETGELELIGFAFPDSGASGGFLTGGDITSDVSGNANAGDITITAEQVRLLDGAQIRASTSGSGNTGNIDIRASDLVEVTGSIPEADDLSKIAVTVNARATGQGGNLLIETNRLIIRDEGQIQAGGFGAGSGGTVTINALGSLDIEATRESNNATGILTGPEGTQASGNGGILNITAGQLTIRGSGAQISNEVDERATGNAGNTIISADRLMLVDGGQIRSRTSYIGRNGNSEGRGGNLQITANAIELSGTAATDDGEEPSGIVLATLGRASAGELGLTAGQLTIRDGAAIIASTFGLDRIGQGGNITINVDAVNISGASTSTRLTSGIFSEAGRFLLGGRFRNNNESTADGGDVYLTTGQLTLQSGAVISTQTVGAGDAGNLTINATGHIQLLTGDLRARTTGTGDAGDITITAAQLTMQDGEATAATNNGGGSGGNVTVVVEGLTELIGSNGGLAASSFLSGDAGNLSLQTDRLIVRDGAGITTESIGNGRAGNLTVIAPRGIEVRGGLFRTGAEANASIDEGLPGAAPFDPNQIYFFPSRISAAVASSSDTPAANLSIQTDHLTVRDGGEISTQTLGASPGGRLSISAPRIDLMGNSGNLRADGEVSPSLLSAQTSNTGNAGDIQLDVEQLQLIDGAAISAAAVARRGDLDRGTPGSISIRNATSVNLTTNSEISTAVEPGVIIAPSVPGGGNIDIQTRRFSASSGAEITASTSGQGNAGDITVRDADLVSLDQGIISTAVNSGAVGQGGSITLNTETLELDRSSISASTSGQGNTGRITISAVDQTTLRNNSSITSTVNQGAIGNSQEIFLQSPQLILDRSTIAASTDSNGDAGNITVRNTDAITLDNSSISTEVASNGRGSGGSITIRTGGLSLNNRSNITSSTSGQGNAGNITVRSAGEISLDRSRISTAVNPNAVGRGGNIDLRTETLELNDRSTITSSTASTGNTGRISIRAGEAIDLNNRSRITSSVGTRATGNSRQIRLQTPLLRLTNGSRITATTDGFGSAGNIVIQDAAAMSLSNSFISTNLQDDAVMGNPGQPRRNRAVDSPAEGNIRIDTRALQLTNGAAITASTSGRGNAGNVVIPNAESIQLDGSAIRTEVRASGRGRGGSITLGTAELELENQSTISSASQGSGRAGNVTIDATESLQSRNSQITTSAESRAGGAITIRGGAVNLADGSAIRTAVNQGRGDGGSITIDADSLRLRNNSDIQTNVAQGTGAGGDITVTADSVVAFDDSDIISSAPNQGGDIRLNTPVFFGEGYQPDASGDPNNNGRVDLNATGSVSSGAVEVPDTSFIQNSLADLPENAVDADQLLANSCIARSEQGGTFLITGPGGLPTRPGASTTPYPTGPIRAIPDAAEPAPEQRWQPGNPIVEPQGVYRLPNGRLVLSRECSDS